MIIKKNIFAIVGSATNQSTNKKIVEKIAAMTSDDFNCTVFNNLRDLPQFDTELSTDNPPAAVVNIRKDIEKADGVLICTPEYIFSIPSGLKNLLEWCVATTIFTNKPVGLITASLQGRKGHEELQLVMRTLLASFTDETTLLIEGVKSKVDETGEITDKQSATELMRFIEAYRNLLQAY